MKRSLIILAAAALATLSLAACGSTNTDATRTATAVADVNPPATTTAALSSTPPTPLPAATPAPSPAATPAATPAGPDIATLGGEYLAAVAPVNAAVEVFGKAYQAATTTPQLVAAAAPAVAAFRTFGSTLVRMAWPQSMKADVRALTVAYAPVIGDLENADIVTDSNSSDWAAKVVADVAQSRAAADAVRADLKLPAPYRTQQ